MPTFHLMRTEDEVRNRFERLEEAKTERVRTPNDANRAQQERLALGVLRWVLEESDRFPLEIDPEE